MAAIFINDGGPYAEEYENNYIHFNANNAEVLTKIESVLASQRIVDPVVRKEIETLCRQSLEKNQIEHRTTDKGFLKTLVCALNP